MLIEVLREGHHDVALSRAEFVKLATWVDTNGQYYGSYFGLRNLRHRDTPGFREPPSLESAYGVRPGQISDGPFEPVPAELVAHWPFDEQDGTAVYDASHGSRPGGRLDQFIAAMPSQLPVQISYVASTKKARCLPMSWPRFYPFCVHRDSGPTECAFDFHNLAHRRDIWQSTFHILLF